MNAPIPTSPEELEQRLRRIARATTDVVWEWDVASDTIWWNPNFQLLFGHPQEQAPRTNRAWLEHLHPEDRARVVAEVGAALAGTAELWGAEYRFRRADGSYADVFDRGHIERDPAGKAVRVVRAMMDVTERRAAEEALRQSEARFRSLSSLTSDWIWETDAEHRFIHTPPRLTELIGYRAPHYVGKRRWEVAGLSPLDGDWSAHQGVLARRESFRDLELLQEKDDGSRAYLQVSGEPVYGADGVFAGYRGTAKDVTRQKTAEEALRESEARFRALVELSSDWYWEQDEHLRFLPGRQSAQKDALRAAGYVGKTRWEVVGASLDDPAWAAHKALLERREPFEDFEYGRIGGDGVYRWVSISGEPVFDAAGRFRGYRGVGRDITARRQAEAEREKLARAYASLSAVNELVARAGSASELLQGACEIAVASGDFLFAVARRVERESATTRLVAFAGVGHPERLKRPLDLRPGSPDAQSLMVRAHQTGRPVVIAGDAIASTSFLGSLAAESGVRAGAAYPLMRNDECIGGLLLCSRNPQAFAGESGALFERMATNISLGLEALETGEALRRFRVALDRSADLIGLVDRETMRFVDANETLCRLLGYSREELVRMRPDQVLPFSRAELEAGYDAIIAEPAQPVAVRSHYICRDGSHLPFEATRHAVRSGERWLIVGIGRDIRERLAAEEALRRKDAYFRSLVENLSDVIGATDMDWRYLYAGPSVERILGFKPEEMVGRRFGEATSPEKAEAMRRDLTERLERTGQPQLARFEARYKDGTLRIHEAIVSKGSGPQGQPIYVIAGRDVTDRVRAEEDLRRREEEFRALAENAPDGIMRFDAGLRCLYANAAIGKTTAHPAGWYLGRRLEEFGLPADLERAMGEALREALASGETQTLEFVFAGPGGERHYQARLAPERGPDGRPTSVLGISRDMTDRKQFERHIEHLATHDGLTGLPNRALLGDRLEQAIAHAKRSQGALALLFVDLDHFKLVNDSFGHGAGDTLLVEVARRLRETVREGDTVARLGGDEFAVLLTSLARAGDSSLVARKVAEALDRPVALEGGELRVTASIGISLYPEDGDGLDRLLQSADAAMYRAKDSGRNSFQYYSAEMGEQARARVEIEAGLRRALERGELRLYYQPQVDLASGAVSAVEALLRWEHPQRGMVSPAAFIPVAEESGLIVPIGQWVLGEACREAAGWAAAGLDVKVAVNLSARQFWRGSVTEAVRGALDEAGLPAARLEVEITESVVARDLQQVMLALEQLRRMGVSIAIDDFGTGYSSLAYLRSLPITKVKIDKSFIHGIPADREGTALVGEIVRLAHVLSLGVVAEGVETPEQARLLRDAGCEAMQGFLFARPMPAAEVAALLRSGRRFVPVDP